MMDQYKISDKTSYCLGMSLTIEAILNVAKQIDCVYLSDKANKNNQLDYLLNLCKTYGIKVLYDEKIIEKLSLKENCYCIGVFRKFQNDIKDDNHIVLYGFNDFGELGTILRSSVSFDFNDIVLVNSDIDYFDPRCIRSSMGSIFHTNIVKFNTFDEYLKAYPMQNIYPFISKGTKELKQIKLNKPFSIVIPQIYDGLDKIYKEGYYLEHSNLKEISLSSLSSIVINYIYHENSRS